MQTGTRTSTARAQRLLYLAMLPGLLSCGDDNLAPQRPALVIEAQPAGGQSATGQPVGIDFGQVALFGAEEARFLLRNRGTGRLDISAVETLSESGGTFSLKSVPTSLGPAEDGELVVEFSPASDGLRGEATFNIASNDAESPSTFRVAGTGLFVGTPTLEVCYGASCYQSAASCSDGTCELPSLDFGKVAFDTTATEIVTVRNVPEAGTCISPPDAPVCSPVCRLTFDADPERINVGFALESGAFFEVAGAVNLPFAVDAPQESCGFDNELEFLFRINAGTTEETVTDTLIFETNDPNARVVRIPLRADIREAPTAVAKLRCDPSDLTEPCSIEGELRPLSQVFLDGRDSFDPDGLAITRYEWSVISTPQEASDDTLARTDFSTALPNFIPTFAGEYVVRLIVENEDGVRSPPADIIVRAIPASRVSVELGWRDNEDVDLDLHVVPATEGHRVCSQTEDCFWDSCSERCVLDPNCEPVAWFPVAPRQGPNPRLDRDDIEGPGPETINIDEPEEGSYRLYVHYFGIVNEASAPMRGTVRVFLDGVLRGEFSRTLRRDEIWALADIEWNNDGSSVNALPSDDSGTAVGSVRVLRSCPDEGLEFSELSQ